MTISNLIPLLRNGLLRNSGGISGRSGGVGGGGIVGGIVRKQQHTIRMTNRSYSMSSFILNDTTTSNSNSNSNTNNNTNMDYFPSDDYFPISDSPDDTTSTATNDNNTFPFTNSTSSTSTSTTTPTTINTIPRKGRPWNDPYELTNDDIENANATQKYRTLDDLPDWNKDMISRTSLERLKLFCCDDDNITTTTTNGNDDDITKIANNNTTTNTNIPTLTQILQLKLPTSHPKHPALSDTSSSPFSFSSFGK